jgi:hypothetical protein
MDRFVRYLRHQIQHFLLGYLVLLVLIPLLATIGFSNDPPVAGRYLLTWAYITLSMVFMVSGVSFCYDLLFARLGGNFFSLRAIPFHLVAIPSCVLLGIEATGLAMAPLMPAEMLEYLSFVWRIMSLGGCPISVVVINAYDRYRETRMRELVLERQALQAQVQALQARIQPHFLFNSLNSVASLIREDTARAETAVLKLSALFRYALDVSNQPFVPLARELESVEGFLELESLRFPDRLKAALHVAPGIGDVPVPPLSLQPLVENAVRHGIAPRPEGGRLDVVIERSTEALLVRVEDDGPGPGGSREHGAGAALADLRKRLELLYADRASLELDRGPLGGCRVTLRLPLDDAETVASESIP